MDAQVTNYLTDGHNLVRHPSMVTICMRDTHHNPMHSVTKQARIPVSTPPMNDPPIIGAESFATCVAASEKGFRVRLRQTSTVADDSLMRHWVINLKA